MPLVRISLVKGKPELYRRKVGDAIHRALVDTFNVPPLHRFQILTEHASADILIVQITLSVGRTLEQKRALPSNHPEPCGRGWPTAGGRVD